MSITKLFLSVSVIAMFAVGSAWATDPKDTSDTDDTVETSHSADIYPSALVPITTAEGIAGAVSQFKDSGIAGVTYVNRMVGVAGGAAQKAEEHAAAAGAYAMDAAESAKDANDALKGKQATLVPGPEGNINGAGSVSISKDAAGVITVSGTDTTYSAGTNVTITGENNAINVAPADGGNLGVMKWGQVPSGSQTSTTSAQIWIE